MADRKGRLENRTVRIKAELFPYDTCPVQALVQALSEKGFITLYESNQHSYIQINKFEKHQFPHHREAESLIPAPVKPRASLGKAHLNPDVLNPDVLNPDIPQPRESPRLPEKVKEWFLKTWTSYPKERRQGKDVAFKRYQRAVKTLEEAKEVARALDAYLASKVVKDGFVMRGSKWFEEWEDWKDDSRRNSESVHHPNVVERPDNGAAGAREQIAAANVMLSKLADSTRFPGK